MPGGILICCGVQLPYKAVHQAEGPLWGAGPAPSPDDWQFMTVFWEWAQISYFNTGDTTFLLIVSVGLTSMFP